MEAFSKIEFSSFLMKTDIMSEIAPKMAVKAQFYKKHPSIRHFTSAI